MRKKAKSSWGATLTGELRHRFWPALQWERGFGLYSKTAGDFLPIIRIRVKIQCWPATILARHGYALQCVRGGRVQTFFTSELVGDGDLAIISVVTRRTLEVEGVISVACCACAIHAFSTHTMCSLCPATTQGSQGPRRLRAGAPACKSVRGYGVANENSQITSSRNTHGQPPRTHFFLTFTALQYVLCSEKENNTLRSQSGLRLFFSSIV
jgi:hypothetical protein